MSGVIEVAAPPGSVRNTHRGKVYVSGSYGDDTWAATLLFA